MAHELHNLAQQSHETLTLMLVGGGIGAAVVLGFGAYLVWRGKRRARAPKPPAGVPHSRASRRKRRR